MPSTARCPKASAWPCLLVYRFATLLAFLRRSSPFGPIFSSRGGCSPAICFWCKAASSGIGTMAIQMARAFGARVATTAGSDEKCSFCLGLGAEVAINYAGQDWAAELASWAQPHGIDAILDMIGGDYFPRHIDLLATGGRLVHIATSHGSKVTVDLRSIMMKRLLVTGSTLRSRSIEEKSSLARAVEQEVWPLFANGQIRPVIDSALSPGAGRRGPPADGVGPAYRKDHLLECDAESDLCANPLKFLKQPSLQSHPSVTVRVEPPAPGQEQWK